MTREHFEQDQKQFRDAAKAPEPAAVGTPVVQHFGDAINHVLAGGRARRSGWNGKGMHIELRPVAIDNDLLTLVCMKTVTGNFVPWLCSVTDMVAYDWENAD